MEMKTELKQISKKKYKDFVEESEVTDNSEKKMKVSFKSLDVAKKFFAMLKDCSICDIQDLKRKDKTLFFVAGNCSSTDSMVMNINTKLDAFVK